MFKKRIQPINPKENEIHKIKHLNLNQKQIKLIRVSYYYMFKDRENILLNLN